MTPRSRWITVLVLAAGMGGCGGGGTPAEDLCSGSGCLDLLPPLDPGSDPGAPDTGRDLGAFDVPVEDPGSEPGDLLPDGEDCGGGFGCPCDVNRDCLSGLCMPTVEGKFCTVTCVENCPSNWKCEYVSPPGLDPIYACVPPRTSLCRPCSKDSDCAVEQGEVSRCLSYGPQGRFCVTSCMDTGKCPGGYTCLDLLLEGEGFRGCVADAGDCPCLQGWAGLSTPCYQVNEIGTCTGVRECSRLEDAYAYGACTAPVPAIETCNAVDDDCNGLIDDGLGESTCGKGVCARVLPNCKDGQSVPCDPYQGQTIEVCNNLDDDCDGLTDELWPDRGSPCDGPDPDSCPNGRWGCAEDGQSLVCESDNVNYVEVCNNLDDDCDGQTDEVEDLGTTSCGIGACYHTVANCIGGQVQTCNPLEGVQPVDWPDPDYIDSNCDGIDGDRNQAVFVDVTSGRDLNPGTPELPKKTLQAGIDAAASQGLPLVLVSLGVYGESVTLRNGIGLYGQYDRANGWQRKPENVTQIKGGNIAVTADNLTAPTGLHGFLITSESNTAFGGSSYAVVARNSPGLSIVACTLQAGAGGAGAPGVSGTPGLNGSSGNNGDQGCEYDCDCLICAGQCGSCSRPRGGSGGNSPCGSGGGKGGDGGYSDGAGVNGANGSGPSGGYGGFGGSGSGQNGFAGGPGSNGSRGRDGSGGGAVGTVAALYVPADGTGGQAGTNGSGGGGGGSGGGDVTGIFSCCNTYGSSGGGGGGGGCGGAPGTGGGGGGASIGLLVTGARVALERTIVKTGNGGPGGAGGYGGTGGQGGSAGSGGPKGDDDSQGIGAEGGRGGKGGDGGVGGGGGGGPSIGVFCASGGRLGATQVSYVLGIGGPGGYSTSQPGEEGLRVETYGCN